MSIINKMPQNGILPGLEQHWYQNSYFLGCGIFKNFSRNWNFIYKYQNYIAPIILLDYLWLFDWSTAGQAVKYVVGR